MWFMVCTFLWATLLTSHFPLIDVLNRIKQVAGTDGAHNYVPGTHLFSLVGGGQNLVLIPCARMLSSQIGRVRFRASDFRSQVLNLNHYTTVAIVLH